MIPHASRHILMTADTMGGVWTYALELTRALAPYGIHVSLATMGAYLSPEQRRETLGIPNLRIFESDFKLEWMQEPWRDVKKAGDWLLSLERRLQPDIVHLNNYAHGALAWRAPTLMVGHSCVLSWWRAVLGEECDQSWNTYKSAVARGIRASKLLVAPSRSMLKALYRHYGPVPVGRVVPNGRSPFLFSPRTKEPFILTAGRLWDNAKNMQILDCIASEIPWPIRVAGDRLQPGTAWSANFSSLEMLGPLSAEQLASFYGRASIYAFPAKYEPFGLSVLEAALSGCALVLGDIPSLREIWNGHAVFVNPDDPSALERALAELIHSPWLIKSLALRSRRRALQFSLQRMAAGYLDCYRDISSWGLRSQRSLSGSSRTLMK